MHMHPGRAGLRRDDLLPKSAQHGLKYPRGVVATTHPNLYPPDPQDNGPPADTSVRQGSDEHPLYETKTVAAIPKQAASRLLHRTGGHQPTGVYDHRFRIRKYAENF